MIDMNISVSDITLDNHLMFENTIDFMCSFDNDSIDDLIYIDQNNDYKCMDYCISKINDIIDEDICLTL